MPNDLTDKGTEQWRSCSQQKTKDFQGDQANHVCNFATLVPLSDYAGWKQNATNALGSKAYALPPPIDLKKIRRACEVCNDLLSRQETV